MTYSKTHILYFSDSQDDIGLTLHAQLIDSTGSNYGRIIGDLFTEVEDGWYLWYYNSFPDFPCSVKIFSGSTLKSFFSLNDDTRSIDELKSYVYRNEIINNFNFGQIMNINTSMLVGNTVKTSDEMDVFSLDENLILSCKIDSAGNKNNTIFNLINSTGGNVNYIEEEGSIYAIHTFTSDGFFYTQYPLDVDFLILGGGGGGGQSSLGGGGGGGAGGLIIDSISLLPGSYSITIGLGGNSGATNGGNGFNGEDTTAFERTALGGGGGGNYQTIGLAGGCGGGAGRNAVVAGGKGKIAQGYNGGNCLTTPNSIGGGGGGTYSAGITGDTAPAISEPSYTNGAGGSGTSSNITGTEIYYGGGGGGASFTTYTYGAGGIGGGGNGGNDIVSAQNGTANTGGGGGADSNLTSGNGGSGIVIVRYRTHD